MKKEGATLTLRSRKHNAFIGGALAALVAASFTIGAGSTSMASTKTTIVLFKHYNSFEKAYDQQIITGFEAKNPGVTVREDLVPPAEEYTKFVTLVAAGDPPNVYVDYDGYGVLAENELAPVDYKALGVSGRAQLASEYISPSLLNDFTKDGVLYGVPEELSNYDAFVNKSYYTAAGLSVPTTWNQVCADGPKMLKKNGSGTATQEEIALPINFPAGMILVMNAIADEFGGPLFNSSGTVSNLTSAPVVAAFQMVQNLVYKCDAFVPSLGGGVATIERTLYSQGSTAMVLDVGSWFSTSPPAKVQHETVVTPYPTVPGHPAVSPDYQYDYTVQKGTSDPALSWKFVQYLQTLGGVAFKLGLYSGLKSLGSTPTAATVPFWSSVWVPTLKTGIYLPSLLKGNEITTYLGDAYASIIDNRANVKQALTTANSEIEPLLNK
jgi:multiple sugar transport system substrate-binding protein